ncbi:glycoside hydrolase family 30 beta sandwich domain-containing protein [Pseudoxanthomonas sp. PXM04]|uniref:glycoside hydrolase family 30 protein n=1 Tax=Pseudoxanthomonas sp. PXM04 TaxID=2769297 RepID=UPI001CE03E2E|nr:glycoside hydrolase family 30 beta sandwich domain-containing protein [Pseudoxanthomonas sp. PXM04]
MKTTIRWRMPFTLSVLFAAMFAGAAGTAHAGPRAQVWITTSDHRQAMQAQAPVEFGDDSDRRTHIEVDPEQRFQRMVGFGASITDSSAWLIQHRMSPAQRDALLRELFGRDNGGLGLSFTRLTIGASDFSRHHYSLDDPPGNQPDPELKHFSIEPNRGDVVPVTRAALAINPQLQVMASPWSAPAWMKSNNSLIQGTLRPEYYDAFARYLLKFVDAYAAEGIPIFALTVQNEPDFEPKDYPGMRLNAPARARFIGDHLGPLLAKRRNAPQIFDWDHNWDKPQEPLGVLNDPAAGKYVSAVAWHCYGGAVDAQTPVHEAFPDKDAYLTECSGGDWEPIISGGLTLQARGQVIGATRNWARGVLFWNLALDQDGGPHAGGCDTCRGVVTIDSRTGEVSRTDEYYALAHASRFVRPGASRIASDGEGGDLDHVAFRNEDDGSLVLVVTNSANRTRRFSIGQGGQTLRYALPARSLATFVWTPGAP